MAAQHRWTTWTKALWLACWNANDVHGWKLELNYILGQHGIKGRRHVLLHKSPPSVKSLVG